MIGSSSPSISHLLIAYRKTFLVPEILYDPSLLLSPHVFLLAILVHNRAFLNEELNDNPAKISELRISPTASELPLALKPQFNQMPLFRRAQQAANGYRMSDTLAISQAMTGRWISKIGQLLGFEHKTISYSLRYFAGNSMDQSGKYFSVVLLGTPLRYLQGLRCRLLPSVNFQCVFKQRLQIPAALPLRLYLP